MLHLNNNVPSIPVAQIVVYPIGIPVFYMALLLSYRLKINPKTKFVVVADEREIVSPAVIQAEKLKLRQQYDDIQYIFFLFENYEPRCWYFEVVECLRRLLLTAIPVLVMRDSVIQIILVMLVSLFFGSLYVGLHPFVESSDDLTASVSQWGISLTLVGALLVKTSEGVDETALAALLILINVGVIVITVALTLLDDDDKLATVIHHIPKARRQTIQNNDDADAARAADQIKKSRLASSDDFVSL